MCSHVVYSLSVWPCCLFSQYVAMLFILVGRSHVIIGHVVYSLSVWPCCLFSRCVAMLFILAVRALLILAVHVH